jgi:hypothetical protein
MSSPRVQKQFEAMPDQIKRLGGYAFDIRQVIRWQGRATSGAHAGRDAAVLDLDSATWADNNRRAILVAIPASDLNDTASMKTQSHASGHTLDGSVRFALYMETPEDHTGEQIRLQRILMHHLVGQLGAPVELYMGTNDVEPTVEGVNGAVATSAYTSAGVYIPWGMAYPGGI